MVKRKTGSPALMVRLPQEVIDLLKARAEEEWGPVGPAGGARAGGASRLVRQWIYQGLKLPQPAEWGDIDTPAAAYQRARRSRLREAARGQAAAAELAAEGQRRTA